MLTAFICFFSLTLVGPTVIALIMLMSVSLLAMLFEILPVLFAAVFSALTWNYFFIPPRFTFHIDEAQDVLMFLLYFVIALVNTVLSFKIRKAESKARDKEEKEKAIKLYNTLLNTLSHELRTPIATIIGAIDMLQLPAHKLSVAQQSDLLHEMNKASIRLNRQVENLLNMSRLESGFLKIKRDWCDGNELIYSVIQKQEQVFQTRFRFEPNEKLPLFKLDGGLIEQVLQNLLHNALQYTPSDAPIEIVIQEKNLNCIITVRDYGAGFPESERASVFQKFYRLPNSKAGGSGLGLSIVKGFVEAHDGTVTLENISTGGAKFTLNIPAETTFISNLKNE
jgi:two-component system sensor histidine kinase KdpD